MLVWGVVLGIHGLYVWARKPMVEIEASRPASWRFGGAGRTVVLTDIVGSTARAQELGDSRRAAVFVLAAAAGATDCSIPRSR
jgi:hypothetical protein